MNLQQIKELLQDRVSKCLDITVANIDLAPVGGGSINNTYEVKINNREKFFLKLNSSTEFPGLFEKEKNGLEFLGRQNRIHIPSVIFCETNKTHQLLLLEWIESGNRDESFWKKFGEQLAQLHNVSYECFGFEEDNYMGSLMQVNTFTNDWIEFFINCRLLPQVELASKKNRLQNNHIDSFDGLFKKLDLFFTTEKPCLLHGDLWSGNFMCNDRSLPVLIDPAVYFGNRSMDLAMTTLFGGFDKAFYDSYHYHFPLPGNYREQWEICNLYPLLIHLNLFGQSYLPGIITILKKFT
jgi:protein-ribulosamine 3-kinase